MSYIQSINIPTSSNTKFITEYSFSTTTSKVVINERFSTILYIADLDTNDIIYNPLKKGSGGSVEGDTVSLDYPMTGLSDSDKLLIVVEGIAEATISNDIETIKKEIKYLNKQISKIRK